MQETQIDPPLSATRFNYTSAKISGLPTSEFRVIAARTSDQVLRLQPDIEELLKRTGQSDDLTRTPEYFLARVREKKARPFALAVYDNQGLAGIVYGVRRCILGIPVGLIECGDSCGDGSIISLEECFAAVVQTSLQAILRQRFVSVARLSWNSDTSGVGERAADRHRSDRVLTRALSLESWNHLLLDSTYEQFLEKLGSQARRNMRYYRRRAEQEGWEFVSDIEPTEASAAMDLIYPSQETGQKDKEGLRRYRQTLREVPEAFHSGLRTKNGEWISVVGGWRKGHNLYIFLQLNDSTYAKASLSTVLRGYVIERAIQQGIRHLKFIDGCNGLLKRYCRIESSHLLVRKTNFFSRLVGHIILRMFPFSTLSRLISETSQTPQTEPVPRLD